MGRPLHSLDLFSGIGGLTLALSGLVKPVLYCDIDPAALAVLHDHMRCGRLPRAAVSTDVREVTAQWLRTHVSAQPEAIVAGFPCIGFSLVGKRQGFANEESALFNEVLRLTDELKSIQYLFLENVPYILHTGMHVVVRELHEKRRFDLTWCVAHAYDVGSPQVRQRWFCIASRAPLPKPVPFIVAGYQSHVRRWDNNCQKRTMCKKENTRLAYKRASLLGNAVIPDQARHAFLHLLSAECGATQGVKITRKIQRWPRAGAVRQQHLYPFPLPTPLHYRPPLHIVLDASRYKHPRGYKPHNMLMPLQGRTTLNYWATPRAGLVSASQVMTERTSHDLPTQVRFEKDTPDKERSCAVGPEFVEWLMGYPKGWTAAAHQR